MRHLRSLLLAGVALAGLLPAAAFASQARIDALGLQSDYVQDYVNVIHYPSTIVRYQNLVYGDLGIKSSDGGDLSEFEDNSDTAFGLDNTGRSMGANLKLWKKMPGVLGVQLNENATPLSAAYGAGYWNRNRNEGVNLLWGNDFGGITAGFQFNRTSASREEGGESTEPLPVPLPGPLPDPANSRAGMNAINAALGAQPWNTTGFGGGISFDWDASGRTHTADLAIQYRSMSYELTEPSGAGTRTEDSDGAYGLAINARTQYATSDNTYLVPVINYWSMNLDNRVKDDGDPTEDFAASNDVSGWSIGLAESWVLRESDLLTLGLNLGQQEVELGDVRVYGDTYKATYSTMPQLFGSVEVHPTNWFHVRVGASKAFSSKLEIEEAGTTTLELTDAPFGYTLGTGFRIGGRLDLDAVINQDFAFTGAWAASGEQEQPFSRLSATYRW